MPRERNLLQNHSRVKPRLPFGGGRSNSPLAILHGRTIVFGTMSRSSGQTRHSSTGVRSLTTALLLLWFLAGHPLTLYADTLDDFDGLGGTDELTRKTRADVAVPLPDPLRTAEEDSRRPQGPPAVVGQLEGVAALAEALQLWCTATLKRLSRAERPPLFVPLQIAPPSCRDGEPPHAA